MNNATDYFATLQQRINSMTPEQLANMTRAMARVVDVDSLHNELPTRAVVYTPHTPNQRRTPRTKK